MATKKSRKHKRREPPAPALPDSNEPGPERAGLSGDDQGLPETARSSDQSVEDLAAEGQPYEASIVDAVEEAGDNPEQPVRVRSEKRPSRLDEADAVISDVEITNQEEGED
jgi:hypothetical protein